MKANQTTPTTIDEYIAASRTEVRGILRRIRATIRKAAPKAEERISYRMPAYRLNGDLAYFAAFKNHIGFYPPVRGNEKLMHAVKSYAGEKGNLRFPLDEPIPYALIARIVKQRAKWNDRAAKTKARANTDSNRAH
jgi:uncharacterized protein YdhG (YjbR/CyaY superfamily)